MWYNIWNSYIKADGDEIHEPKPGLTIVTEKCMYTLLFWPPLSVVVLYTPLFWLHVCMHAGDFCNESIALLPRPSSSRIFKHFQPGHTVLHRLFLCHKHKHTKSSLNIYKPDHEILVTLTTRISTHADTHVPKIERPPADGEREVRGEGRSTGNGAFTCIITYDG